MEIDIKGLNKAEILAGLYNSSKPLGMGVLYYNPMDMSIQEAQKIIDQDITDFDYLQGRVMKVNLSTDVLDSWGYDRDIGNGACEAVINHIKEGSNCHKR